MDTQADHRFAAGLARDAGRLLLSIRPELWSGGDPTEVRAAGDRRSHELLVERLATAYPHDAVLSEEAKDNPERLGADRVWIVDPLDGTREFGEPDRSDWAVHVALVIDGIARAGSVALPARGMTLSTASPPPFPPNGAPRPRILVSRTRPTPLAELLSERLNGHLVPMGSAGAKAMAVVLGEADIYAHSGGQYEWDSAAPVAVAAAAGLHVSRLDGSPLSYNQPDPYLPDLLVCRPEYAERVVDVVRAA
ncbi:MAG TPA: 3'(2'),5'-bisphosphate nucleotidase CysQ [Gaiellaceae bacterium]|nr:3'(2'),5'-bisphosphate nucleotidase CysQ [Gaiellaceae bacterium]